MVTKSKVSKKVTKPVVDKLTAPVFGVDGSVKPAMVLPKEIFGVKVNPLLVAQAMRVFLSNQRKARAKTKTRGDITGSGRKIWKQKGTGRARHGDRYSPIFVGGSKAHGPRGVQNYRLAIGKKMKQAVFTGLLSSKLADGRLLLIDGLNGIDGKTKSANILMKKVLSDRLKKDKNTLLVFPADWQKAILSFRNISYCSWTPVETLNAYNLITCHFLILTPEAVKTLTQRFGNGK